MCSSDLQWLVGTSSTLNGVYDSGAGVYVVGTDAAMYDGGADVTWEPITTGLEDEDFDDLWGAGSEGSLEMFAVATAGNVAHYVGGSWTIEDLGTADHQGVGGSGSSALYSVSYGGTYVYDGSAWTYEAAPGGERLNDVWGSG